MLSLVPKFAFSANLKNLQIRMKSVKSIGKITKAMKMVATAKMKIEVRRLEQGKAFAVGSVQKVLDNESYLQKKKSEQSQVKKTLLVPVSSDRGLCGSCNSSIARYVRNIILQDRSAYRLFPVGDKASAALARPFSDLLNQSITNIQTPINFPTASSIAHMITEDAKDVDQISIVYNTFKNVISQYVTRVDILTRPAFLKYSQKRKIFIVLQLQFKFVNRHESTEPEMDFSKHYFYELYVASIFYHAFLNASASEQSARMNAMESASRNANEMLDKLTLEFNKARQQKITMELIEIISGASAV